jgi:hypothetical protein
LYTTILTFTISTVNNPGGTVANSSVISTSIVIPGGTTVLFRTQDLAIFRPTLKPDPNAGERRTRSS